MSPRKYDVCMLVENSFRTDSRVLREARSIASQGMSVTLLALHDPGITAKIEQTDGFLVQRVALWSRRFRANWALGLKVAEFLIRFTWHAMRVRARVYHAHHPIALLPAAVAAKIRGARLIYDCHELASELPGASPGRRRLVRLYERVLLRLVDRVIMSDGASRAGVFRRVHRYTKPIEYVYNCPVSVDVSNHGKDLRKELRIAATDRVVVYTGNVGPFRGLEVAISSMAFWPDNTHFVMIGRHEGAQEEALTGLAEQKRVRQRVHFWGPVPPDDVALWAADADLSVVLIQNVGLSYYYSTPTKMFESIMARVPQVASDFPEIRRVVVENPTGPVGRVVDPSDTDAVGQVISDLLTDDEARATYRKNADILARTIFNWESQEKVLLALYQEVMR